MTDLRELDVNELTGVEGGGDCLEIRLWEWHRLRRHWDLIVITICDDEVDVERHHGVVSV